jgi:hypothetical protein
MPVELAAFESDSPAMALRASAICDFPNGSCGSSGRWRPGGYHCNDARNGECGGNHAVGYADRLDADASANDGSRARTRHNVVVQATGP